MLISSETFKSALVAYVHYLSFMLCFGALLFERVRLKASPNKEESISMLLADIIYGLAGLALVFSGILRVKYFGQGGDFYIQNPIFWVKISLFVAVGLLSLYPTFTYLFWAIPLRKGELPNVSQELVLRLRLILNIELIGFTLIPLLATFMARGVGLD